MTTMTEHQVSWHRDPVEGPPVDGWRNLQPGPVTDLTCTCGWTATVPNEEVERRIAAHQEQTTD